LSLQSFFQSERYLLLSLPLTAGIPDIAPTNPSKPPAHALNHRIRNRRQPIAGMTGTRFAELAAGYMRKALFQVKGKGKQKGATKTVLRLLQAWGGECRPQRTRDFGRTNG